MNIYDLHVHSEFSIGKSTLEQLAQTANMLGYKGIGFTAFWKDKKQLETIKADIERVKNTVGMEIFLGFEARNMKELRRLTNFRKSFDILLVKGGDLDLNREAVENPEVDILTHPEYGRYDSGLNHVLAKLASKNTVAIEVNFRGILFASRYIRSKILKNIKQNIMLVKKYNTPLILCSGAFSHFEMRDYYSMVSMAVQLGLDLKAAKDSISKVPEKIITNSKERTSENHIMPGVKIVKR